MAVEKPNGNVRICIDLTKLNDSIKRENFQMPTTDELLAQLEGATVFRKLDCNKGFHQIPLDEKSQELTTFTTPFGRFCYKRLHFGIWPGPEVFHREMTYIVADIPGVICDIDGILISGKDKEEHNQRLRKVLERLTEAGATLNEKCVFSASSVKFLGHINSAEGIKWIQPRWKPSEISHNLPTWQNSEDCWEWSTTSENSLQTWRKLQNLCENSSRKRMIGHGTASKKRPSQP